MEIKRKPEEYCLAMIISESPANLKHFRRTVWKFQKTFKTPLKNLAPFAAAIMTASEPLQSSQVIIEQIIFEPQHLTALLSRYSVAAELRDGLAITAMDKEESQALLQAVLSDWVDFVFVPSPKPFAIYADHDEYTTFFANTRSNLNRVVKPLAEQGFQAITDYTREF
jgi:hypothetical protein